MSNENSTRGERRVSTPVMDAVVALFVLAFGAVVVFDSYRLGARWGDDGPQSGYFPFYIGTLLCLASAVILMQVARAEWRRRAQSAGASAERKTFVTWPQFKLVLSVLVPAAIYVLLVRLSGFYVASALYIALFMVWLGKYPWPKSVAIGLGVSVSLFLMFEVWFKVPLYKGAYDLLSWLGY